MRFIPNYGSQMSRRELGINYTRPIMHRLAAGNGNRRGGEEKGRKGTRRQRKGKGGEEKREDDRGGEGP